MKFILNLVKNFIKYKKLMVGSLAVKFVVIVIIFAFAGSTNASTISINPSFRQVRFVDNPTVYYINHVRGFKKAYTSETSYLAYGNKWEDVKIVDQEALDILPNVSLVKTHEDPRVFYIRDGKKAWVQSESEFFKYGFNWSDIVNILQVDLDTYEDDYLATIYSADTVQSIASYDTSMYNGENKLVVELDSSSPVDKFVPLDTNNNLIGVFKLTSTNSVVRIHEINFKINGVFNRELLKSVKIVVGNSAEVRTTTSLNNNEVRFVFNDSLIINSGEEKIIKLYVDIFSTDVDISNQTIQASIVLPANLKSDSEVIGSFPIEASPHNLLDADGVLGKINITEQTANLSNNELSIGTTDQKIIKFTIKEISKSEDVLLKKIVITNSGTARDYDLSKFVLKDEKNNSLASAQAMNDKDITFYLDDYVIEKNRSKTFWVTADIDGGDKATINMQVKEVVGEGEMHGYDTSGVISNIDENISIVRKSLGILAQDSTPSNGVFAEQEGVILGVYEIRNNNKTIVLEDIKIQIHRSDSAPAISEPVYLVNYETGEMISSLNGGAEVYGFDVSNIKLQEKKSIQLAVISEIPESAKQGDKYYLTINSVTYQLETGVLYVEESNIDSKTLIVSRSNLFVYNDNEVSGTYITKGQKKVEIANFYIETSYGDDTRVTSLTFTKGNTSGLVNYDNGFSNVQAYIGNKKVGEVIAQPFTDTLYFGGFESKLADAKRYEVRLVADTETDLNVSQTQMRLTNITATSYTSGINTVVNGLGIDSKPVYFGTARVQMTVQAGGQVVSGEKGNLVGSFSVSNIGDEEVELDYIIIITSNEGFSYSRGYDDLRIVDTDTGRTLRTISKPTSGANKISMRNLNLEKDVTKTFNIYVDADRGVNTEEFQLYFAQLEAESDHSGIEAVVSGSPSQDVKVVVN